MDSTEHFEMYSSDAIVHYRVDISHKHVVM